MKLSGTATIGHPVRDVYAALTDPAILVRTLPGCQRLELVGPDEYAATMAAGVGSIKGLFDGQVRLTDQSVPESFTLHASGAGVPGTVDAVAHVRLVAGPSGGTEVHYAADATVGGVIGGVGQRMLAGVARRTAGEFFAAVDRELATLAGASASAGPTLGAAPESALASASSAGEPGLVALPAPIGTPAVGSGGAGSGGAGSGGAGSGGAGSGGAGSGGAGSVGSPEAVAGDQSAASPRAVWTRPGATPDAGRHRVRELVLAASFGAGIALLGVIIGAIVAGW